MTSPDIPNADRLLHADCNELEVMCEVSRYSSKELQDSSDQTFFMVSITVEELDFSISLILETLPVEKTQSTLMQSKLNLPLSQSGTLLTKGTSLSVFCFFNFFMCNLFSFLSFFCLCYSNICCVFQLKDLVCSSEGRRSPGLRLQTAGGADSSPGWRGVAAAAPGKRLESTWLENNAGWHRRCPCRWWASSGFDKFPAAFWKAFILKETFDF